MEVSGQPHALTIFVPEKEQTNILPWPGMEPGFTIHSPVSIPITPFRHRNTCVKYGSLSVIRPVGGRCGPDCRGIRTTDGKLRGIGNIKISLIAKLKLLKTEIVSLTV
jgi:hypothetical protein